MKLYSLILSAAVIAFSCAQPRVRLISENDQVLKIEVISCNDTVINRYSPGAEDNKYGFEGGRVVKVEGIYHLFTAEMYDDPFAIGLRLGHWVSKDGADWRRVETVRESDGDTTGISQRSSVWAPMVVYNEADNRWHMVYVCYKGKPNEPNVFWANYDGVIQHAVSVVEGKAGINGPYKDRELLLRYDDNPDPWEGLQGTDSFFPFKVGKKWVGFYGSATTQDLANCKWQIGLAQADRIEGPWTRMTELNPVSLGGFAENPIVNQLENGVYIAIVDGRRMPGYSLSWDGFHWSELSYFNIDSVSKRWWSSMRTPLSLIKEDDGTYTMFFTAFKNYDDRQRFGCVSKATIKIEYLQNN